MWESFSFIKTIVCVLQRRLWVASATCVCVGMWERDFIYITVLVLKKNKKRLRSFFNTLFIKPFVNVVTTQSLKPQHSKHTSFFIFIHACMPTILFTHQSTFFIVGTHHATAIFLIFFDRTVVPSGPRLPCKLNLSLADFFIKRAHGHMCVWHWKPKKIRKEKKKNLQAEKEKIKGKNNSKEKENGQHIKNTCIKLPTDWNEKAN